MARNDEIEAGAKAIAKDCNLPGGRTVKLARVVARHLHWFDAAEDRGLTWDDMIALLAIAGVRRPNGLPLSRGTLSSAVWRKRNEVTAENKRCDQSPVGGGIAELAAQPGFQSGPRTNDVSSSKEASNNRATHARQPFRRSASGETGTPNALNLPNLSGRKSKDDAVNQGDAPDVLAFMKQAAKLRQRHDDG